MAVIVATVANKEKGYFHAFVDTCRRVGGVEPQVWGMGEEWGDFRTFIRLAATNLALLDPAALVLLCDSFDLIFTSTVTRLENWFAARESGSRDMVVLAKEQGPFITAVMPWMLETHFGEYDGTPLNSGTILARAGVLASMFKGIWDSSIAPRPHETVDDQKLITQYLNEHRELHVVVDDNNWFLNLPSGRFDLCMRLRYTPAEPINKLYYQHHSDGRVHQPVCVHRSGHGDFTFLFKSLGYTPPVLPPNEWYMPSRFLHHTEIFLQAKARRISDGVMKGVAYFQ